MQAARPAYGSQVQAYNQAAAADGLHGCVHLISGNYDSGIAGKEIQRFGESVRRYERDLLPLSPEFHQIIPQCDTASKRISVRVRMNHNANLARLIENRVQTLNLAL